MATLASVRRLLSEAITLRPFSSRLKCLTNTWLSSKRDKRRHLCIELTRELRKIRLRARLPLLVEGTRVSEAVIGSEAAIGAA